VLQIGIDDISSDVMNEILNFMYTNRCLISLKNAPNLLFAAKRFELERLRKQIAEFLLTRLNLENAIEMLICAHEAGSIPLKSACISLINRHAERIKRTEKWKTFKREYLDLVPELYENRVERPTLQPAAFLPDVFSLETVPAENLLTLNRMYENPVKQRLVTPATQMLPPPTRPEHSVMPIVQQVPHSELLRHAKTGPSTVRSPIIGNQGNSTRRRIVNNTQRRPGPPPIGRQTIRTTYPAFREPSGTDGYRRPVHIYDKNNAPLKNNPQSRTVNHQHAQKQLPGSPSLPTSPRPARFQSPSQNAVRIISAERLVQIERSPTLTSLPQDEHTRLARVVDKNII
jgi:hypothetical protein